jgi:cytoskeletal protein CcmA (bactofilin family)
MAIKSFMARAERGMEAAAETPARVAAAAPAMRTVSPATSVDAASVFEGKLRCKETLRIDGRIAGEVECEKTVLVGEGAVVEANIAAEEVKISGVVKGDIAARRKITLERTAVVTGDLTTPGIVIEEGAKLKGRIVIGSDEVAGAEAEPAVEAKKAAPQRKPRAGNGRSDAPPPPQPEASPTA